MKSLCKEVTNGNRTRMKITQWLKLCLDQSHTDLTLVLMTELFKHNVMLLKRIKSYCIGSLQHGDTLSLCQLYFVKYLK